MPRNFPLAVILSFWLEMITGRAGKRFSFTGIMMFNRRIPWHFGKRLHLSQ
jgi:hypothetical protein